MLFPIPTVDPLEFCQTDQEDKKEADDEHDEGNDEESSDSNRTDSEMPHLEEDSFDGEATSDIEGSPKVNDINLDTAIHEETAYATRTQKNHPSSLVIGDVSSPMLIRRMCQSAELKYIQSGLLACFLSQNKPKKVHEAMKESRWIEAIQDERLQFRLQKVWKLVDLPKGQRAIGKSGFIGKKRTKEEL